MIIKEMPFCERPREKMMRYGSGMLTNSELLAIVLGTGTKEKTAIGLAEDMLSLGSEGMVYLEECSVEELAEVPGVGPAKACQVKAAIEIGKRIATQPRTGRIAVTGSGAVADICMEKMRYYKKEYFVALLLNAKGEIISEETIAVGDLSSSVVHPRETFAPAVKRSAAAMIVVHNHPSGDPTPSPEDIDVTRRLIEAGNILGIKVLDHVIIGDGRYTSFKADGIL